MGIKTFVVKCTCCDTLVPEYKKRCYNCKMFNRIPGVKPKVYTCKICTNTYTNMHKHLSQQHSIRKGIYYKCSQCNFKTQIQLKLKKHLLNHDINETAFNIKNIYGKYFNSKLFKYHVYYYSCVDFNCLYQNEDCKMVKTHNIKFHPELININNRLNCEFCDKSIPKTLYINHKWEFHDKS